MYEYHANVRWTLADDQDFAANQYCRDHVWAFDDGLEVPASAAVQFVAPEWVGAARVDPEQAFVASLSSCHMLWFLGLAAKGGYVVTRYQDQASGVLARNEQGRLAMTEVTLRPVAEFRQDAAPGEEELRQLHHQAHDRCFIANSVRSEVRLELP